MTDIKRCTGCGAVLQTQSPTKTGYVSDLEKPYCQRCFRIRNYGDYSSFKSGEVSSDSVLEALQGIEGTILLVVDITDIESGLFTGIQRHLRNRDFLIAITKRDLLPMTVSDQKILQVLSRRLKEEPITLLGACLLGDQSKFGIDTLRTMIRKLPKQRALITVGYANVGKSTLLNALISNPQALTIAPYPHTTLEIHQLEWEGHTIFDTPGIRIEKSLLDLVPFEAFTDTVISKPIRPVTFQLDSPQCFVIPNVGSMTLYPSDKASVTLYFSSKLKIHRTKAENRETYVLKNKPYADPTLIKMMQVAQLDPKMDVVFKQIGWFCLQGEFAKIEVHTPMKDQIHLRKAMI